MRSTSCARQSSITAARSSVLPATNSSPSSASRRRHEDDVVRGVRAAIQIGAAIERLPEVSVRGAVATGQVVAPGPAGRLPVAGAPATRARRLAERAPLGEFVADAATAVAVGKAADLQPLAPLTVRGTGPIDVFGSAASPTTCSTPSQPGMPLVGRDEELRQLMRGVRRGCGRASSASHGGARRGRGRQDATLDRAQRDRCRTGRRSPSAVASHTARAARGHRSATPCRTPASID